MNGVTSEYKLKRLFIIRSLHSPKQLIRNKGNIPKVSQPESSLLNTNQSIFLKILYSWNTC